MAQPYVGEVRMFAGNFAPMGWMFCSGQILPIFENETLFQLIGTTYGGDGLSTFGLPDLQGRVPIHFGNSRTGTTYILAQNGGAETVTLTTQQIPVHTHPMTVTDDPASTANPQGNILAVPASATPYMQNNATLALNPSSITPVGGSQPHNNFQPYLCVNFIISLFGIFPSPN
jgi:microcystin-dependent protein